MIWHKIKNYNDNITPQANKENGVDLPDIGRFVIGLWDNKEWFFVNFAEEYTVDGTYYHDGMIWAYIDLPDEYEGYKPEVIER